MGVYLLTGKFNLRIRRRGVEEQPARRITECMKRKEPVKKKLTGWPRPEKTVR